MLETTTLTPLGHKILDHWTHHRPTMVEKLDKGNQLQQAVFAAQELTGNLLYELMVVQKMDYQFAWEIATREWAFLPDEEDQPHLSFDPTTLDPHQPLPAISA
jgi:hypothetical protein